MSVDQSVELVQDALTIALLIAAPPLLAVLVVGLVVSTLQAVTQIQDQTIGFVSRIIAGSVTLLYFLPWTISRLVEYSTNVFSW